MVPRPSGTLTSGGPGWRLGKEEEQRPLSGAQTSRESRGEARTRQPQPWAPAPLQGLWTALLTTRGHGAARYHPPCRRKRGPWPGSIRTLGRLLSGPSPDPRPLGGASPPHNCHLDNVLLHPPSSQPLSQKWGRQPGPSLATQTRCSLARPVWGTPHLPPQVTQHGAQGSVMAWGQLLWGRPSPGSSTYLARGPALPRRGRREAPWAPREAL